MTGLPEPPGSGPRGDRGDPCGDGPRLPGLDPIGWLIATLHQIIGHDKTAAYLRQPAGDKTLCLICAYEATPDDEHRRAVYRALAPRR